MKLTDYDLKQIDEHTPSKLSRDQLIFLSINLISDLKEARQVIKEKAKIHAPHEKGERYFESILINNHGNIRFYSDIECRAYLELLQQKFKEYLLSGDISQRIINKQIGIIGRFVDYLCFDCDLQKIDNVTVGMANSSFRKWHLMKIRDATEGQLKTAIGSFFFFLYS